MKGWGGRLYSQLLPGSLPHPSLGVVAGTTVTWGTALSLEISLHPAQISVPLLNSPLSYPMRVISLFRAGTHLKRRVCNLQVSPAPRLSHF